MNNTIILIEYDTNKIKELAEVCYRQLIYEWQNYVLQNTNISYRDWFYTKFSLYEWLKTIRESFGKTYKISGVPLNRLTDKSLKDENNKNN